MDDLIVIILTLIFAAAGIFGQMKKKKQMPEATETQKSPENIWDLFKDEEFLPAQETTPQEYFAAKEKVKTPEIIEPGYNFEPIKEGGFIRTIKPDIHPMERREVLKKKVKFHLKDAVIYSEILNRKYF